MNDLEILSVILGLRISEVVMILVLGLIMGSIPIYFVARHFNKNVSFEKALGATILSEIVFPVITGISFFLITLITIIASYNHYISYILGILLIFTLWIIMIIIIIIGFIAVLYIYKTAFNVGLGTAFVISIVANVIESILISIVYLVALGISTVNTPVGTMEIDSIGIIGGFMLGLLLSTIFTYLVAKRLNINISFLSTSIVNLFPGIVSFIITIISSLLFILVENDVGFFIGAGIIFIVASIFYKYILNISWRKAIIMSIIFSVLWPISSLFTGLISFSLPACC
ncbi:hypothetical protein DDW05_01570 [Candidatus Nanobsidianus stetteri]|uniref:Uncharacterized protein n=1 Tax=Nanobsidianus stetteri TaxID=1294122 RepID=A0A2T9WTV4_NANST|nr:hypothetical protein DDW05_01570 [Candidatus Nanobsidianus stetteri]